MGVYLDELLIDEWLFINRKQEITIFMIISVVLINTISFACQK